MYSANNQKRLELNALKSRTFSHGITKKSKRDIEREAEERKKKEEEEYGLYNNVWRPDGSGRPQRLWRSLKMRLTDRARDPARGIIEVGAQEREQEGDL